MRNLKKNNGITLISLVVTIIVLLILAAVSLSLVAGSDGLLNRAANAVDSTTNAQITEEIELAVAQLKTDYYYDKYITTPNMSGNFATYLKGKLEATGGVKTASGKVELSGTTITYTNARTNAEIEGTFDSTTGTITILGKTIGADGSGETPTQVAQTYTITYAAGSGTGSMADTTVTAGNSVNLRANTFTRDGYTFSGWSDGTNTYTDEESVTPAGNLALTAQWAVDTWIQTGTTVTKGNVSLTVGQAVTGYSVTVGGTTYGDTKWNVLGAKDGKLLITTNANVGSNVTLTGRSGYLNGISTLNTVVAGYINTTMADSVRTIDVDDINRVTGYNPLTAGFEAGNLYEYGNEVTYYWDGTDKPNYSGSNNVTGNLSDTHNNFYYPDANESGGWASPAKSTTATTANKSEITTLTSNFYYYYPNTLTTSSTGTTNGIATNSAAYTLLFKEGNAPYWLGSECVYCVTDVASFGLRCVNSGDVYYYGLAYSDGREYSPSYGVRPVVSLKSSVQVTSAGAISID